MNWQLNRKIDTELENALTQYPIIILSGATGSGKDVISFMLNKKVDVEYFHTYDCMSFMNTEHNSNLIDPHIFFQEKNDSLITILEASSAYRKISEAINNVLKIGKKNGRFLILLDCLDKAAKQFIQSLNADKIQLELSSLLINEISNLPDFSFSKYWLKGGTLGNYFGYFEVSLGSWDIPHNNTDKIIEENLTLKAKQDLRLFFALSHGDILNASQAAQTLNYSESIIKRYITKLNEHCFLRVLPEYSNKKKPRNRLYFRDTGYLHSILKIDSLEKLKEHPLQLLSWKGLVIENVICNMNGWNAYFYESIDLLLVKGEIKIAIFCSLTEDLPSIKKEISTICNIEISKSYIVTPTISDSILTEENVSICNLTELIKYLSDNMYKL